MKWTKNWLIDTSRTETSRCYNLQIPNIQFFFRFQRIVQTTFRVAETSRTYNISRANIRNHNSRRIIPYWSIRTMNNYRDLSDEVSPWRNSRATIVKTELQSPLIPLACCRPQLIMPKNSIMSRLTRTEIKVNIGNRCTIISWQYRTRDRGPYFGGGSAHLIPPVCRIALESMAQD